MVLPTQSVEALAAYRDRQPEAVGNGEFVFCHSGGAPLDPDRVAKEFKRMAKKAGFEDLRPQDLRHTHASLILAEGVHLKVTSERLGHSSTNTTGNLDSHVQPTVQKEAADRFGDAWSAGMAKVWQNEEDFSCFSLHSYVDNAPEGWPSGRWRRS